MTKSIEQTEVERHRTKMAKRKAVQDAEVAGKTVEKGLLIVHTGTGKGKSTAAFGLALRMLGRGHRVGVVQFIKGAWHSAERDALAAFGEQVSWHTMGEGFTWETQDIKRDIADAYAALDLRLAESLVAEGEVPDPSGVVAHTLLALSRLALAYPEIESVDVNPLIVTAERTVAVDALLVVER